MTQEEQHAENVKMQNDAWVRNEKSKCRQMAIEQSSLFSRSNETVDDIIDIADKIYNWLIQDFNP